MKRIETKIDGLVLLEPQVFGDERGFFMEMFHREKYMEQGITEAFVQDNLSSSARGVLRGLHFQKPHGQGKLVSVLQGEVYDVAVDLRPGSETFGQWEAVTLDSKTRRQFYVPPGFAHGFQVVSEMAMFQYKCTDLYHPEHEYSLAFDDKSLNIPWPLASEAVVSGKDQQGLSLQEIEAIVEA